MIIRPTTQETNRSMLNYIFNNQNRYNESTEQVSTGQKLNKPSDNPTDASTVLNINKKLSQLNGYIDNMDTAQNELNVLDNSMATLTSSLQKANDLAIEATNETNSATVRSNIKQQIDQIIKNVVAVGNTNYNGTYIFAGTNVGTVPFQELPTGGVAYTGTPQTGDYQRYIQISDGVTTAINAPGDQVLGSYDAATNTGSGILKTLYDLSNALGADDTAGIRATTTQLQTEVDNTSSIRTTFASITSRFEITQSSIDITKSQLTSYRSDLQDIDISEAVTNLKLAEVALQATMQVASMTMSASSLLNYM